MLLLVLQHCVIAHEQIQISSAIFVSVMHSSLLEDLPLDSFYLFSCCLFLDCWVVSVIEKKKASNVLSILFLSCYLVSWLSYGSGMVCGFVTSK